MKYEKVVGRLIPDGCVLFKLENGVAAGVDDDGSVSFWPSWAQVLRFAMVDARGAGCVPANVLRKAEERIAALKETDKSYQHAADAREQMDEKGLKFMDELETEQEEWCRQAKKHPDGSLVWGYNE